MTDDSSAVPGGPEEGPEEGPDDGAGTGIDTTVPHSARIWNYWLGGKDNFAVDRAAGDEYIKVFPGIVDVARTSRARLARSVAYLAGEQGIRQFLDVGTGLPTANNTHQVAQRVAPESRIVYVDNDPLVLAHARALLTSSREGATAYIHADLREPDKIIAEAAKTLDFDRPIALILHGILGHIPDTGEARSLVRRLMDALPSGSYLDIGDGVRAPVTDFEEAQQGYNETGAVPYVLRTPEEIASFFDGLELVEPGLVPPPLWRPEGEAGAPPGNMSAFGGVGRKP
jgi:O-methyltransferase involved in polyketide biosynthesis